MSVPLVSVVLPCWNAERHLPEALESLLAQTHGRLEVVAVDDGSEDGTRDVLARAAASDDRVRLLVNDENLGLIRTLNRGVAACHGEFIARMDADDVCLPRRFERQLELFRRFPDTQVAGTGVLLVDEAGEALGERPARARTPEGIRFLSYLATPVAHPTLLARAEVLRRLPYREGTEALHAEDYELLARMVRHGVVVRNTAAPFLRLRQGGESVSRRFEAIQVRSFTACAREHLEAGLGIRCRPAAHAALVNRMDGDTRPGDLREALRLLDRLRRRFLAEAMEPGPRREIRAVADQQRVDILLQALLKGRPTLRAAAALAAMAAPGAFLSPAGRRHLRLKRVR